MLQPQPHRWLALGNHELGITLCERDSPGQQCDVELAFGGRALLDARVDLFEDPRHTNKNCRRYFAKVWSNLVHSLAVVNSHPAIEIHIQCLPLKNMR